MCISISRVLAWVGGAGLLLSALLISTDVVTRAVWKVAYMESFELSKYSFAIAVGLGMSYALVSKAHIRIELLYAGLSLRWRAWLDVWAYMGLALVSIALVYWCGQTVFANAMTGARSNSSLAIPLVWPQAFWLFGFVWLAVVAIVFAVFGFVSCLRGRSQEAHAFLGTATLQEEIKHGLSQEKS